MAKNNSPIKSSIYQVFIYAFATALVSFAVLLIGLFYIKNFPLYIAFAISMLAAVAVIVVGVLLRLAAHPKRIFINRVMAVCAVLLFIYLMVIAYLNFIASKGLEEMMNGIS